MPAASCAAPVEAREMANEAAAAMPSAADFIWPSVAPLFLPVVRRFAGDVDVVDVALAQARGGDADEAAIALHLRDGAIAGIAHRRLEAPDELVDDVADRALVRH